jgi:hypothetical protein
VSEFQWERGWVQRANRNSYQAGELLDAVNMQPDPEGGGVATRLGDTLVGTTGGNVHSLYTAYTAAGTPVQYQGGSSTLYRNFVPILTGLTGLPLHFATMQGFGENHIYTFFAGGQEQLRVKDDGTTLTQWGVRTPTAAIGAFSSGAAGQLQGFYGWRQVYVRKPVIAGGVFGRWDDPTGGYNLTGTYPWFLTDGFATNNGTVFGAPQIWDEVVLQLTVGTGTSGGSIDYSYWNGVQWIIWATVPLHNWSTSMTSFRSTALNGFPLNSWVAVNGLYLMRIRVLVNPPAIPRILSATFYDGVFASRSNGSPNGVVSGEYGPPPLTYTNAVVSFSNPNTPPDMDTQATHVAIYRTTGHDGAAQVNGQVAGEAALFFFERDYPAGTSQHISAAPDSALGELLEIDNDRPPIFDTIAEYQQRIFGAKGNRLYFSKRFFPEAFPGTNYLDVGSLADPIRRLGQFHGTLYIWTAARIYALLGSEETSFDTRLVQCPTGLGAAQSVAEGEKAVYFLGGDGHLWGMQGTIAENISRIGHQQLFSGVTLHGVPGINPAALSTCVGHWGNGRYYLSYPVAPFGVPSASLFIDEARGSWWRDTRAWQSLFYDRQANAFYGGLVDGKVVLLHSGTTDHGAAITGTVQTRDDDAGLPDSDKDLSQLVIEIQTSATGVLVVPVVGYALAPLALGTVTSPTYVQQILPAPAPGTYRGLTLGYVLTGVAPWALYGLIPHVLRTPIRSRTWQTLPTTFAWAGPKILDSLLLDVELVSGTLTWQLVGDGLLVEMGTITALGRQVRQLLTMRHEATVFSLVLHGTGLFLLHDGSVLSWRPLPPPIYTDIVVPTDLGTLQDKVGLAYALDIELLSPGTVTTTFYADGVLIHTLLYSTLGRQRTERFRLPATMHGRLMEIRRQSTALYRLWPGTDFTFQVVGSSQEQHHRPVTEPYGTSTQTSLLQLRHTEEV